MVNGDSQISYETRLGTKSDINLVSCLFAEHFASELTSRDPDSSRRLQKELEEIENGSTLLVVALNAGEIVGAGLATQDRDFSKYEPPVARKTGYLSKNVVSKDLRNLGIGKAIVGARLRELKNRGVEVVYSSHHADNISSAKALDAFGFEYVDSYLDLEKRLSGSRMTAVRRLLL